MINLSCPDITDAEIKAVTDVLKTPYLSLGPKLKEFEQAFCDYTNKKHAIAVNSGTSGLFLALLALNIGPGDEVITTPFTFIATVNSIIMVGAKPVFVDIDPVNYNIDADKIEEKITEKTKAIIPVIVFGNPFGIDEVVRIAKKHNLAVIEDSCEALGTEYKGKKAGTFGDIGLFAFYPNKQMTTGEGGIIITDNDDIADMCNSLRNQGRGKGPGWLAHERVGYNFRLSDINCALGIVQLSRINEFIKKRTAVAQRYQNLLKDEKRITVPKKPDDCVMSWFVFVIKLNDSFTQTQRDFILKEMHDNDIQVSNYFPPVHLQPFMVDLLGHKQGDFPVTDNLCQRTIAIPFHNNLPEKDAITVVNQLKTALDKAE